MTELLKNTKFLEEEKIYFHSSPASSKLYDSIWTEQNDFQLEDKEIFEQEQKKSNERLSRLFSPSSGQQIRFSPGAIALDVCAGHGKYSFSSVDLGSDCVIMCDGSRKSLSRIGNLVESNKNFQRYKGKIFPVQANIEKIVEAFTPRSFDIVFQRFAIHHMRNPMKTAHDLASLVKPGGVLCFNYFAIGCTSQHVRELRSYFLTKSPEYIRDFFSELEYLKSPNKNDLLRRLISVPDPTKLRFKETSDFLNCFCEKYGFDVLSRHIHYEDANTPYVHNIDRLKMENFVTEKLGLYIVDKRDTADEQSLTLIIPPEGSRILEENQIPDPKTFSSEDVRLGDNLVQMLELGD